MIMTPRATLPLFALFCALALQAAPACASRRAMDSDQAGVRLRQLRGSRSLAAAVAGEAAWRAAPGASWFTPLVHSIAPLPTHVDLQASAPGGACTYNSPFLFTRSRLFHCCQRRQGHHDQHCTQQRRRPGHLQRRLPGQRRWDGGRRRR